MNVSIISHNFSVKGKKMKEKCKNRGHDNVCAFSGRVPMVKAEYKSVGLFRIFYISLH